MLALLGILCKSWHYAQQYNNVNIKRQPRLLRESQQLFMKRDSSPFSIDYKLAFYSLHNYFEICPFRNSVISQTVHEYIYPIQIICESWCKRLHFCKIR